MNIEESKHQIETLIESWQLNEADLNQMDIDAMKYLLKENQDLNKQLEENEKEIKIADSIIQSCFLMENKKAKYHLENG